MKVSSTRTDAATLDGFAREKEKMNNITARKSTRCVKKTKQGKQGRSGGENRIAETAHAGKHIYKKFE